MWVDGAMHEDRGRGPRLTEEEFLRLNCVSSVTNALTTPPPPLIKPQSTDGRREGTL